MKKRKNVLKNLYFDDRLQIVMAMNAGLLGIQWGLLPEKLHFVEENEIFIYQIFALRSESPPGAKNRRTM